MRRALGWLFDAAGAIGAFCVFCIFVLMVVAGVGRQLNLQVSGVNRLGVELVCIRGVDCDSRAGDVGLSRVGGGGAEGHATEQGGRSSGTREKLPQLHEKPSLPYCD